MKTLKIIGIVILVLIVVVLLLGLVMPKKYHIERSETIKAPQELIFKYAKFFKLSQKWSPWKEYDLEMKVTYEGEDGTIGAKYFWEGNDKVGKGVQEITAIDEGKRVDSKLTFIEPWQSEDKAYVELTPEEEGIKVTWGFDGEMDYPMNVMMPFIGMDKALGTDLEKGLGKLKTLTEKMAADKEKYGFIIYNYEYGTKQFLGKKAKLKFPEIGHFFEENLPAIDKLIKENNIETDGAPSGLYYFWDMENMATEMAAAVPVKGITESPSEDYELITVKAPKALKIKFYGNYSKIGNAHNALDAYIKDNKLKQLVPVIEMYVTDPVSEPDTSKWLTKVIYPVE
ncbi:MAG: hypothetical protein GXO79_01480 [Chlorobi bacterium]|nr:hypothetical protein [Chlorobiota bacterium]